jgi:imidazolonepropionase
MVERKVVGVLLPTTAHILRIRPPPARTMIDRGMCVALGSDFNPNAHCMSMPFVMNLACVIMKMTVNEALCAATLNAAASVNRSREHGSLETGKWANFVVIAHADWRHLIYEMVDPPIESVWVRGRKAVESEGR